MDEKLLRNLMKKHSVPDYVSLEQLEEMIRIMSEDSIHPNKGGCDMTLEITVGIPNITSIMNYYSKSMEPSIYAPLFDEYNSKKKK